ncbi:uncharacterized protein BDZ99DRAFT_573220 [Mytilinidion resinicola]|uniref:Uncharacterized protein n=1 Tax=Mytilinidion resinicola TaxID=574789 RepID=A0A6A6YEX8_9PEZI|nr:uncharacterized protein BDZ99DRAFT_573220 [Mytilinidion resinicola]KAF2807386.1 hypothetical protein BDZ99DRAFT_573220 [Mytilinidion resinicola]
MRTISWEDHDFYASRESLADIDSRLEGYTSIVFPELADTLNDDAINFVAHILAYDIHMLTLANEDAHPTGTFHGRNGANVVGVAVLRHFCDRDGHLFDEATAIRLSKVQARLLRRLCQVANPEHTHDLQRAILDDVKKWEDTKAMDNTEVALENRLTDTVIMCELSSLSLHNESDHRV